MEAVAKCDDAIKDLSETEANQQSTENMRFSDAVSSDITDIRASLIVKLH